MASSIGPGSGALPCRIKHTTTDLSIDPEKEFFAPDLFVYKKVALFLWLRFNNNDS
jgi:hypothetical protein